MHACTEQCERGQCACPMAGEACTELGFERECEAPFGVLVGLKNAFFLLAIAAAVVGVGFLVSGFLVNH